MSNELLDLDVRNNPDFLSLPECIQEVVAALPPLTDRRAGADYLKKHLFEVSHRTLESWALPTMRVNGRALFSTATLFAVAYAKLAAAPVVMGGKRTSAEQHQVAA